MAEYIDREKVIKLLNKISSLNEVGMAIADIVAPLIEKAPTADAVEVKHEEWLPYESEESYGYDDQKVWYKCSACGKDALGRCPDDEWYSFPQKTNYCPHCGAKMDGTQQKEEDL